MKSFSFNALILLACLPNLECAKILGIFHMGAYSHYQLGETLLSGLAQRGHQVTMISPFSSKSTNPNFKDIVLTGAFEKAEEMKKQLFEFSQTGILVKLFLGTIMGFEPAQDTLRHPAVQDLLKSNQTFDLVILEVFANEAFRGFCHYYNAPCVLLSTIGPSRWTNPQMGNPGPPSYIPEMVTEYSTEMNFFQRMSNSLIYLTSEALLHLYSFPKQNELMHQHFPDAPHLRDIYYNVSLMLLNSHVSVGDPVPLVPNMINIAGYHVKPLKKLPQHLQEYLDGAPEGVVYFSMGSNVKSAEMPIEKRDAILKALSKLKYKVLWKWEKDHLPGQPSNVKLMKWVPQSDVLAHPNIKLFITHGGLLSTIEAIHHGVPVVGLPVFGDQISNMQKAELIGYGRMLPFNSITEETLSAALNKVIDDPSFTKIVKERSKIMHDEPTKPLDRAIFWTEYVLRHKGAPHLRTAALNLTWYQYFLLDVTAVIVVSISLSLVVLYKLTKKVLCGNKCHKQISSTKKNK